MQTTTILQTTTTIFQTTTTTTQASGGRAGLSLGEFLSIAGLVMTIVGLTFAGMQIRISKLTKRMAKLEKNSQQARTLLDAWTHLVVFEQRVVTMAQGATEWNTGMIDRLWARQAKADRRIDAMKVAKNLSICVERSTQEMALFSPDKNARMTAARQLAGGLGSLDSLEGFEAAILIWPKDEYLRAARDRLVQRLKTGGGP